MPRGRLKKDNSEDSVSKYKIDICDNYFALKDTYCYTLYYTRNKIATPSNPNVDKNETTNQVLGYYTDFNKMLWDVIRHRVDIGCYAKANVTLKEYAEMFHDFENELKDIYGDIR
jgi:hypothetical protein